MTSRGIFRFAITLLAGFLHLQSAAAIEEYALSLPDPGYRLIGNPFDRGGNALDEIMGPESGVVAGSRLWTWDASSQSWSDCSVFDGAKWSANVTLPPGRGAAFWTPAATVLHFSGTRRTTLVPVTGSGWHFLSAQDGRGGTIAEVESSFFGGSLDFASSGVVQVFTRAPSAWLVNTFLFEWSNPNQAFTPASAAFARVPKGTPVCPGCPNLSVPDFPPPCSTEVCTVAPPGLMAWWAGDPTATERLSGQDGSLANGASYVADGRVDGAFSFDGIDDYVSLGTEVKVNDFTIMAWVKVDPASNQGERRVISKDSIFVAPRQEFFLKSSGAIAGDGHPAFEILDINQTDNVGAPEALAAGWHHLAGVRDAAGRRIALYVDGVKVAEKTNCEVTAAFNQAVPVVLGQVSPAYNAEYFAGLIDEVAVFGRALGTAEIAGVFAGGSAGMCEPVLRCTPAPEGIVAWWAGDGNAIDRAGNVNGSLQNQVTFAEGIAGTAFRLKGPNASVLVPDHPALRFGFGDMSIQAWIKTPPSAAPTPAIFYKEHIGSPFQGIFFNLHNGKAAFAVSDCGTGACGWGDSRGEVISPFSVDDDEWHHIVGVRVTTGYRLYVDGRLVATRDEPARDADSHDPALIGSVDPSQNSAQQSQFIGLIDEVALWNRALTDGEVASLFAAGSAGMCKPAFIESQPESVIANAHSTVALSVTVGATPPPAFQWRFNGVAIPSQTANNLLLQDILPRQAGLYDVVVLNSLGAVTSQVATVRVRAPERGFFGLGDLPGGKFESRAMGVSFDGSIVVGDGTASNGEREGFIWKDGWMEGLEDLPGGARKSGVTSVSGDGHVVTGYSAAMAPNVLGWEWEGFRWQDGFMRGFARFGDTSELYWATSADVSRDGSVIVGPVGFGETDRAYAAVWKDGVSTILPELLPGWSNAYGVDASGRVIAGKQGWIGPYSRACAWVDQQAVLLEDFSETSQAWRVSSNGRIIAGLATSKGVQRPVRWEDGRVEVLGDLPGGVTTGINHDGSIIVGFCDPGGPGGAPCEPFIWDREHGMRNLKSVLVAEFGAQLDGWTLTEVNRISADGTTIVGQGRNPDGQLEAWVARFGTSNVPTIAELSPNLRIVQGSPASLGSVAVGPGSLNYRWWHNGNEVPGAIGTFLSIPSASATDAGDYVLEASNASGRTLSKAIHIDVLLVPAVVTPLTDKVVFAGSNATLDAGISGAEPFDFKWFKTGTELVGHKAVKLELTSVSAADDGFYSVVVTNAAGHITNGPVRVRVHSPVTIRSQLPPITARNEGQGFSFTADVDGSGPFQFQWRLNGQDIPGATAATYSVPAATLEHAGTYTVVIVDEFGAVTSDPALVVINTPVRPAGDNFSQRVSLAGIASPVSGTTLDATVEKDEPLHAAKPGLHSVWYSWSSPVAGRVTLRTVGSAFDTLLAVYTGTAINALTEVVSNDDAPGGGFFTSEVSFSASANTVYAIAIAGLGDESGSFVLSWAFTPAAPPVPQIVKHPESATQVAGGPVTLRVVAENAASVQWQLNDQLLAGVNGDTLLLPSLDVSQVGTYVAVLRGGGQTIYSHPAIVEIGPQVGVHSYDKPEEFDGAVDGGGGGAAGSPYQRENVGITAPALIVTPGLPVSQWVNNAVNTTQQGEQNHCDQLVRRTGWMPIQSKVDGYLVITATNTTVPTVLALYEAASQLQSTACAQGNTVVLSSAKAGQFYWLAFGSKTDTGGPIKIVCTAGVPPPFQKFDPEVADIPLDSTVKLVAPKFEGMNPPPKYTWYRDGKTIEGAESAELILSGADVNVPGRYTVQLDNGVGRALYDVALLDLDRPLTTRSGNGGGPGFDGTTFGFHLDGNPGQQVSVTRGTALDGWTQEEAFWLPAGGLNYRDPNAGNVPIGFYAAREVPLTVVPDGTYTDGRRGWKVIGGRLGRSYVLEASADDNLWTPVRTNRVAEGAYHHVSPAGGNGAFLRVKP